MSTATEMVLLLGWLLVWLRTYGNPTKWGVTLFYISLLRPILDLRKLVWPYLQQKVYQQDFIPKLCSRVSMSHGLWRILKSTKNSASLHSTSVLSSPAWPTLIRFRRSRQRNPSITASSGSIVPRPYISVTLFLFDSFVLIYIFFCSSIFLFLSLICYAFYF